MGPAETATVRLIAAARAALADAASATDPPERYCAAHLAALRAAAAVLAARARPCDAPSRDARSSGAPSSAAPFSDRRSMHRPTSAWVLLTGVAPELGEWAAYFAAGAGKRAAARAGWSAAVSPREADDLTRDAEAFLTLVAGLLGASDVSNASGASGASGTSVRRAG